MWSSLGPSWPGRLGPAVQRARVCLGCCRWREDCLGEVQSPQLGPCLARWQVLCPAGVWTQVAGRDAQA
eukprot:8222331-Lingulodinium_polyedra.AAC.1